MEGVNVIDGSTLKAISEAEEKIAKKMEYISDFLFKNPELGMKEFIATKILCDTVKEYGFSVTQPFCGMETAFLAELDNGDGPTIAFVAEYDALPGFGPNNGPGHACGHNWISATSMGAAIVMSAMKDAFKGKLLLIGCPGMENHGSKVDLIKENVFDNIDVVIQPHLEKYTCIDSKSLALDAIEFSFKGRAAHPAVYPEEGINALDAVQFTFIGINALKNYLKEDVKIHGVISDGGEAPNVIPGHAACKFYLRAEERRYLDHIKPRIISCAEGAAMMSGAEMNYRYFENSLDNIVNNSILQEIAMEYISKEGIIPSTEYNLAASFASTDIGNVSHVCPTLYMEFEINPDGDFRVHGETAMKYVNSRYANHKLHQVVRIMAGIAIDLFNDESRIKAIKIQHRKVVNEQAL